MSRRLLLGPFGGRRLAAAAVLPLALSLTACGGDGEAGTSGDGGSSGSSASGSAEDSPAEPTPGEQVSTAEFMEVFEAALDEATTAQVTMTMDNAAGDLEAEGEADYTTSPIEMTLAMSGAAMQGQQVEMRIVDGVVYLKGASMGPQWLRIDLDDPDNPLGSTFTDQLDPRSMLDGFAEGLDRVVYEGEERIDGEPSDHYALTVDAETVFEASGQQVPQGADVPEAITYDLFFDAEGRYRRLAVDMGEQLGTVQVDMTGWGEPVSIQAPPAAEVTEFPGSTAG